MVSYAHIPFRVVRTLAACDLPALRVNPNFGNALYQRTRMRVQVLPLGV
jgi:hypothetical protein